MNGTLILGILLVFGIVGVIVYAVGLYNTLVRLSNNIDKSWSNIDVILKQRHDELPKLVAVPGGWLILRRRETVVLHGNHGAGLLLVESHRREGDESAARKTAEDLGTRRLLA